MKWSERVACLFGTRLNVLPIDEEKLGNALEI